MSPFGKELLILLTLCYLYIMTICNFNYFSLWFGGRDFGKHVRKSKGLQGLRLAKERSGANVFKCSGENRYACMSKRVRKHFWLFYTFSISVRKNEQRGSAVTSLRRFVSFLNIHFCI